MLELAKQSGEGFYRKKAHVRGKRPEWQSSSSLQMFAMAKLNKHVRDGDR